MNKKSLFVISLAFILLLTYLTIFPLETTDAAVERIMVTAVADYQPGFYWCQHGDDRWSTYSSFSDQTYWRDDAGGQPGNNGQRVETFADIAPPTGMNWEDEQGNKYPFAYVLEAQPSDTKMQENADLALQGQPRIEADGHGINQVVISGIVGQGVRGSENSDICGGNPGYIYPFPVTVTFTGYIEREIPKHDIVIKHFTTSGQSLSHIFPDVREVMVDGQPYPPPPPTHTDYTYKGHKKTTTANDPTGPIVEGLPPSFTYDGSHPYTLFYYYAEMEDDDEGNVSAQFHITPDPVPYGSTFTFQPTNIENDTGKNIIRTEWRIRNPRNLSQEVTFDRTSINDRTVTSAQYPSWMPDETRNYPVEMYVQLQGETTWRYMDTQTLRIQASDSGPNDPGNITARFEVIPNSIFYRDTFRLRPIEIDTAGCTYDSHQYRISHFLRSSNTARVHSKTQESVYTAMNYPLAISTGSHTVYIKVFTTDCGETDWISPESLTVLEPIHNQPPDFQVAWVERGTQTPVSEVLEGTILDLIYLDDPPPYDPDGDRIEWMGFDLEGHLNEWVRNIPQQPMADEYTNGWHRITMDRPGTYSVPGSFRDEWGAMTTKRAIVTVVAPNPVPIITGPARVVEGRPLDTPFRSDQSYSPVRSRTIDHNRDEWTNVRDIYPTPGIEVIELHVYDNTGMKSLEPARHELIVLEDLPPVPQLEFAPMTLRDTLITLRNTSYSPDGDQIVETRLRMRYDSNNDGSVSGESVQTLSPNAQGNYTFRPTNVGKYYFELYVEEDWGKHATETFILEVVNDRPFVTFSASSTQEEPFVPPFHAVSAAQMSGWPSSSPYGLNQFHPWRNISGTLRSEQVGTPDPRKMSNPNFAPTLIATRSIPYGSVGTITDAYYLEDQKGWILYRDDTTFPRVYYFPEGAGASFGNASVIVHGHLNYVDLKGDKIYLNERIRRSRDEPNVFKTYKLSDFINGVFTELKSETIEASHSYREHPDAPTIYSTPRLTGSAPYYHHNPVGNYLEAEDINGNFTNKRLMMKRPNGTIVWQKDYVGINARGIEFSFSSDFTRVFVTVGNISDSQNNTYFYVYNAQNGQLIQELYQRNESLMGVGYGHAVLHSGPQRTMNNQGQQMVNRSQQVPSSISNVRKYSIDGYVLDAFSEGIPATDYFDMTDIRFHRNGSNLLGFMDDQNIFVNVYDGRVEAYKAEPIPNRTPHTHSQLYHPTQNISDFNINFTFRYRYPKYHFRSDMLLGGFGYRIQDHRNMYRVEFDDSHLYLVRIVNGTKTQLRRVAYPFAEDQSYSFRIEVLGNEHRVYVNHTPVMTVTDSRFSAGSFGPMTEIPGAEFSQVGYQDLSGAGGQITTPNVAIVDAPIAYTTTYEDTENDPIHNRQWTYVHTNTSKFLNAGDGKSGRSTYHNKTYATERTSLDRVGVYRIDYRVTDNPHPNNAFAEYRENSNTYSRELIVHRRPIADFDVAQLSNGTIRWTDRSYDPDRWLSSNNYSRENTGINYQTTRGIVGRQYYYISPSGNMEHEQLVTPQEQGVYTVGMAVVDEYGAWSDFVTKTVNTTRTAAPNEPPIPGFTVSPSTIYRNTTVSINSTASDPEDGGRNNLPHEYYIRNVTEGGGERIISTSRTSWTHQFPELGTYNIRQIVRDSVGQTAQYEREIQVINRKPIVHVTTPSSTSQSNPTLFEVARPTFRWTYGDADGDTQQRFQIRISQVGGQVQMNSGLIDSNAQQWIPEMDLPEMETLYVEVRAYDGYEWSNWSQAKYFYIQTNQAPTADFDWTPKPIWEGDIVKIHPMIHDPDDDLLHIQYEITDPEGFVHTESSMQAPPYSDIGPQFAATIPGNYTIRLTVDDGTAPAVIVSHTLTVYPLTIQGAVYHTPEWETRRLAYNEQTGVTPRSADTFWAGEVFLLRADVTNTEESETQPESVRVILLDNRFSVSLSPSTDHGLWTGQLWDESFDQLPDGSYTFRFLSEWSNGTVKEDLVTVQILGSMWEWVQVHRRR